MGRHCFDGRLDEFLWKTAKSRQAVLSNAWNLPRELPAKELPAGLSHPRQLLRAAGADLQGVKQFSCRPGRAKREPGPILPGLSRTNGVWVPAFAGTTVR